MFELYGNVKALQNYREISMPIYKPCLFKCSEMKRIYSGKRLHQSYGLFARTYKDTSRQNVNCLDTY